MYKKLIKEHPTETKESHWWWSQLLNLIFLFITLPQLKKQSTQEHNLLLGAASRQYVIKC